MPDRTCEDCALTSPGVALVAIGGRPEPTPLCSNCTEAYRSDQRSWTLTLPYPRPPLSLNDRGQSPGARAAKSALIKMIRADVAVLARVARIPALDAIHVRLHWQPPDNRRRDPDNLVATLKPCIDGLVTAGIVPDDCAPYVAWSAPRIHPAAKPARLWLEVREVA